MPVNLPSINVPLTDQQGRINPIWHEFLRSFVSASVSGTVAGTSVPTSVTAGNGLTSAGINDIILTVGQGQGMAVNANDVAVDINSQTLIQAQPDDEILVSDVSENNTIRKTRVRDIAGTTPGGATLSMQYNGGGAFSGDDNFVTNGAGSVSITGDLTVDSLNFNGRTISSSTGDIYIDNHLMLGNNIYITAQGNDPAVGPLLQINGTSINMAHKFSASQIQFASSTANSGCFLMSLGSGSKSLRFTSDNTGMIVTGEVPIRRGTDAALGASTVQTQGNGALVADINEISTVTNTNDVVTLPTTLSGRHCLVVNNGANQLQVFPASGSNLGEGTNAATTIAAGMRKLFVSTDATTWEPVIGDNRLSTAAGITASTTQTQGQQALTNEVNEVSTCANANDVVTLPAALAGRQCLVINNGANTLQVFPASGDNLGAGVNTSTTVVTTSRKLFVAFDSTNWEPVI